MWFEYNNEQLKTGDVIEVTSSNNFIPDFVKHYGIVFHKNNETYVSHSTVARGPEIQTLNDFINDGKKPRIIARYFRDAETEKLTDEHIETKSIELIDKSKNNHKYKWDFWTNNCEDYVKNICPDCRIGTDHRSAVIIISLIVLIAIITTIIIIKRRK